MLTIKTYKAKFSIKKMFRDETKKLLKKIKVN